MKEEVEINQAACRSCGSLGKGKTRSHIQGHLDCVAWAFFLSTHSMSSVVEEENGLHTTQLMTYN